MLRRSLLIMVLLLLFAPSAGAEEVRYFGVWSYLENALAEEIAAEALADRKLGYWGVEFDGARVVLGGTYFGAGGTPWLKVKYIFVGDKVYADLYGPDGEYSTRKSTKLSDLKPVGLERR